MKDPFSAGGSTKGGGTLRALFPTTSGDREQIVIYPTYKKSLKIPNPAILCFRGPTSVNVPTNGLGGIPLPFILTCDPCVSLYECFGVKTTTPGNSDFLKNSLATGVPTVAGGQIVASPTGGEIRIRNSIFFQQLSYSIILKNIILVLL